MSRQSLSLANTQSTWEQTSESNDVQNGAGGTFRGMLDTVSRLHRGAHIGAYHKKSCYTGARAALPKPLRVPSFAQTDIIKALSTLPASRHTRTAMHAATKLPLMHTYTHSARGAVTPCISLCPHGADLAGVIYTVLVTLHGTSSSLPCACSWTTREILLQFTTRCFKANKPRTSFP